MQTLTQIESSSVYFGNKEVCNVEDRKRNEEITERNEHYCQATKQKKKKEQQHLSKDSGNRIN